jgi:hypothetical protein
MDKVFDLTGEALEKFGNFFKRDESSQEKMPTSAAVHSGKLMKSDRSGHIKKPSGFMSQKRDTIVMKVVDVDTNGFQNDTQHQIYSVARSKRGSPRQAHP